MYTPLKPSFTRRKKIGVFPLARPTLFQTPDSVIFLSVKMKNKNIKHRPSTKYLYFHKTTGPTLFFSEEKNRKIKKKKVFLPTDQFFFFFFFFQHVNGNTAILLRPI